MTIAGTSTVLTSADVPAGSSSVVLLVFFGFVVIMGVSVVLLLRARLKRVPPNKALVLYGRLPSGEFAQVHRSGAVFVWPIVQDYAYLDFSPIDVSTGPGRPTARVAIGREPGVTENAAVHLLNLSMEEIAQRARVILSTPDAPGEARRSGTDAKLAGIGLVLVDVISAEPNVTA